MRRISPLFLVCVFGTCAFAQTVTINKVELAGDKVIVYYKLENSNPSTNFLLNLYGSNDNFTTPLTKVTGDIGVEVKPGLNKKVEWNLRQEYGNYKGKLALEIRGKVYTPFVKLQNFTVASAYKRGKTHEVIWAPGNTDPINIELFKGNERVAGSMSQPNSGAFGLAIPGNAKTGADYRLKISSAKNTDEVIYSSYFKVKPKTPFLIKALVPLAIAGGAIAFLGGGSKKESTSSTTNQDLPLPGFPK